MQIKQFFPLGRPSPNGDELHLAKMVGGKKSLMDLVSPEETDDSVDDFATWRSFLWGKVLGGSWMR